MVPAVSIVLKQLKESTTMSLLEKSLIFQKTIKPKIYFNFPKGTYYSREEEIKHLLSAASRYKFASNDSLNEQTKHGFHMGTGTEFAQPMLTTLLDDRILHDSFILEINEEFKYLKFRTNATNEIYFACLFQLTKIQEQSSKEQ